jgi:hypothetical protein
LDLFPEANIDEKAITEILKNYENNILPLSMKSDAVAASVLTKEIENNETYTYKFITTASFLTGSKTELVLNN